eukprot:m.24712 g.24712  ORF g.24712 m.24712 type:complete len:69 (+) comp8628_c0_seq1:111-317(+)
MRNDVGCVCVCVEFILLPIASLSVTCPSIVSVDPLLISDTDLITIITGATLHVCFHLGCLIFTNTNVS